MKSRMRRRFPGLKGRLAEPEVQTDILAAALIGAAVGVAATMLLRPRPRLGDVARDSARDVARRAGKRTEAWLDSLPNGDEIKEKLSEYVETAREGIDRIVEGELRSLRKRIQRQRHRMHI